MNRHKSVEKQLLDRNKLHKYLVAFDIVLKKPSSERFDDVLAGEVKSRKEIFYARGQMDLQHKVTSTYSCTGKIVNLEILKDSAIIA